MWSACLLGQKVFCCCADIMHCSTQLNGHYSDIYFTFISQQPFHFCLTHSRSDRISGLELILNEMMVGATAIFKLPSLLCHTRAPETPSIMNNCICGKSSQGQTDTILMTELFTWAYSWQLLWLAESSVIVNSEGWAVKTAPEVLIITSNCGKCLLRQFFTFFAVWGNLVPLHRRYLKYLKPKFFCLSPPACILTRLWRIWCDVSVEQKKLWPR